jgi:hypothetical protein
MAEEKLLRGVSGRHPALAGLPVAPNARQKQSIQSIFGQGRATCPEPLDDVCLSDPLVNNARPIVFGTLIVPCVDLADGVDNRRPADPDPLFCKSHHPRRRIVPETRNVEFMFALDRTLCTVDNFKILGTRRPALVRIGIVPFSGKNRLDRQIFFGSHGHPFCEGNERAGISEIHIYPFSFFFSDVRGTVLNSSFSFLKMR